MKGDTRIADQDEQTALYTMKAAYDRLRHFGWNDPMYCQKDGSTVELIEPGSCGIHQGHYEGTWPDGCWWVHLENGDEGPSYPVLARTIGDRKPATTSTEKGA